MTIKHSDERIKQAVVEWINADVPLDVIATKYGMKYNTLYGRAKNLLAHIARLPTEAKCLIREKGLTNYFEAAPAPAKIPADLQAVKSLLENNPASLCNKPQHLPAAVHAQIASMQHAAPVDAQGGGESFGKRIGVLCDAQVKPGIDFSFLARIGRYFAEKRVDCIVNIGDFADMPSLSFHDVPGSKNYEGQRYREDILSVHHAMKIFMEPIIAEKNQSGWNPRMVLTLGNHEHRIDRTIQAIPKLDGTIGLPDLEYERWGWEVYPFLTPVVIEGIAFCHYFTTGQMGRPASTARAMLNKQHMSCFAGHQQGRDIAYGRRADGREMTAIICGSSYEHDEEYLNHQTNKHFRGIYILNDVTDGEFEEMPVSLKYLRRKYGAL
jgi:hypothetical protein